MMHMKKLYLEKISILQEVLSLTQSVGFKGNDDDAEKYIDLIAKREELFEKAKEIDKKLDPSDNTPEAGKYRRELGVLAKQIIEQDNYMNTTVLKIREEAKADLRNINTGKNLSNLYGSTLPDSGTTGYNWSQ